MNFKSKSFSLIFLVFGLAGTALAKSDSVTPVNLAGLPLAINHSTEPGSSTTKTINLSQLAKYSSDWNITCNYSATETGNGRLPIFVVLQEQYYANYDPQVFVDGKYVGDVDSNPIRTTVNNKSGTIEYTNVFVYRYSQPELVINNFDGTGNLTITQCIANYVPVN